VGVAQWLERLPVEQEAGGSNPLAHPRPDMYYVYVIQSIKNGKYYIGSSTNLTRRLTEHNSGKNISTKNNKPYKLVYSESFVSRSLAMKREYKIKSYKGGNAFRKMLNSS
jgi:putative endonuclease